MMDDLQLHFRFEYNLYNLAFVVQEKYIENLFQDLCLERFNIGH